MPSNLYEYKKYLLRTTCLYDSRYLEPATDVEPLISSPRDLFDKNWVEFYRRFGILDQVSFLALNYNKGGPTDVERWRHYCRAVEQAYIDSFKTAEERAEQQRIIDAGGGPFFAGYRKAIIDLWPEAWL